MSPQSVCVCKCVCFCVRVRDLVAAPRHSEAVRRRGDLDGGNRSSAARDVTKVQAEHAGSVLADRSSAELAARSLRP
ncbi:uncharacterized protein LOC117640948 isoform X4 [Thrips palmi]|uniref:Uncharacterized protein LOC117640948 isoform X4 n=1 Tax=Thrips palmi TaxID=161013 RepID=A0A6P8YAW2_THRPL|nr:uncharacterized protein LOC117640948 isoform X4 [Thrips palmi]